VLKVLFIVALFALAVYLLVRMVQRSGGGLPTSRPKPKPSPPRRPVAPDDDMDFLRDLDRKRKHPDDPDA
jgi:hypothetical protein